MKLQTFLYLLLRDALPAGVVEGVMQQVEVCKDDKVIFSNPYVAAHALELAQRLTAPTSHSKETSE